MSTVGHGIAHAVCHFLDVPSGSTPNSKKYLESFKNYCKLKMYFLENHKAQKNVLFFIKKSANCQDILNIQTDWGSIC